jgi:predicted dehydrogenase
MYTPVLRYVERCQVTALCDPYPAGMEQVRSLLRSDCELFTDFDDFLKRAPVDAVIIATPIMLHHEQVLKAARSGKHIMCEKPLGRTLAECDEMIAACQTAGVLLTVGFMKRFDKSLRYAKQLIESGRLGRLDQVICEWRGGQPSLRQPSLATLRPPGPNWRPRLETLGGAYQDLGSHTTDIARYWLGDVELVSAEFSMVGADQYVDNSAVVTYQHVSGVRSVHLLGFMRKTPIERYQFDGTLASLEAVFSPGASFISADPFQLTLYEETEDGRRQTLDETQYAHSIIDLELARSGRYKRELDHLVAAVLDGAPLEVSGEDGRKAIEAINAGYLSAYLGQKIRLPLTETPDLARIFTEMKGRVGR